jgi:PPIC-type PPIASE domain
MVKGERRVLADAYGKALALSLEATRRGLDRDPRLQAQLRYSRLIMLANAMSKEIYKDALNGRDQDAEQYYASHKSLFERFNFERLYIPLEKRASSPSQSTTVEAASEKPEDLKKDEMKQLANQVYARALAGEDFGKLQREVFATADIASDPNIKLEDLRRGDLSEVQNVVFDLKPNQVSSLLTDQTGYFIYKLVSRTVPPFDTVKPQVTVRMQNDKSAQGIRSIEKAAQAQVNSAYFDKYDPPAPSKEDADMDAD